MKRVCHWLLAATILLCISATQIAVAQTTVGAEIHARWLLHLNDQGLGKNYNHFDAHRGWLTVNHDFNEDFSAKIIGEAAANAGTTTSSWDFHLRAAYLQANEVIPYVDVRVGMQDLLWMETVEGFWGLRYVDEVSLHKLGYLNRADLGLSLIGNCPGGYGILALQIMNGGGYMDPEMNKYKDMILYGEFHPFPKNADWSEVAVLGQLYMGYPNVTDNSGTVSFSDNTQKDRSQFGTIIQYRSWLKLFAEYFVAKDNANPFDGDGEEVIDEANGFNVFGKLNVATTETWLSRVSIFGKYERVDKNKNAVDPLQQDDDDARYLTAGISYEPVDNWEFAFALMRNTINTNTGLNIQEDEFNSIMFSFRALVQ